MRTVVACIFVLLSSSVFADAFRNAGERFNIDPDLIRAVVTIESSNNPWALNINGAGCNDKSYPFLIRGKNIYCSSRENAVYILNFVANRPYLLSWPKSSPVKDQSRTWFSSKKQAMNYIIKHDVVHWVLEKKSIISTDIGYAQINWKYHRKNIRSVDALLNKNYSIFYAAALLRQLSNRHGPYKAIGYYHSMTNKKAQDSYRQRILKKYRELKH